MASRVTVDPGVFTEADPEGRTGYKRGARRLRRPCSNAGFPTRWPRIDPATVVMGMTGFDLNDNVRVSGDALDSYDEATLLLTTGWGLPRSRSSAIATCSSTGASFARSQVVWDRLGRLRHGDREPRLDASGIEAHR